MSDRVDAPVDSVQAAGPYPSLDPRAGQAGIEQLRDMDDAVLAAGNLSDDRIGTLEFGSHIDPNPGVARRAP